MGNSKCIICLRGMDASEHSITAMFLCTCALGSPIVQVANIYFYSGTSSIKTRCIRYQFYRSILSVKLLSETIYLINSELIRISTVSNHPHLPRAPLYISPQVLHSELKCRSSTRTLTPTHLILNFSLLVINDTYLKPTLTPLES